MSVADDAAAAPLLGMPGVPGAPAIPGYLRDEAVIDSDSRFLTVAGVAVHYKRWSKQSSPDNDDDGNGNVVNLLCMHGFGASLLSYELCVPQLRRLDKVGEVVAFDTPGFGRTQRPPLRKLAQYTPAFVGATLARAFVDQETDGARVVLVGHSMGALVALEAAADTVNSNNSNVCGIVLIAPAVVPVPSKLPRFIRMLSAVWILCITFVLSPILCLFLRRLINRRKFWKNGLAASRTAGIVDDAVVDAYMKPRLCTGVEWGLLNFVRAMSFYRASRGNIASRILVDVTDNNNSNIPVLIVHGSDDKLIPVDNSRELQQLSNSNIELRVMKGGHCPHEENPAEFAAVLHAFLERLPHSTPE